jgi:CBS domain-containing protein
VEVAAASLPPNGGASPGQETAMGQQTVREAMTHEVVTVHPDTPFKAVVQVLAEHGVDAAPVVDETGALLGMVSGADLTCHEEEPPSLAHLLVGGRSARDHVRKARARTARELMSTPVRTTAPGAEVCEALREMDRGKVGRLPVVDDGRLVGILTRSDLLAVFLRPDGELEREVDAAVRAAMGGGADDVRVVDADGIAYLRGTVDRTTRAWAAVAAAADVRGVVDVEDELVSEVDDSLAHELSVRGPFV